MAGKDVEPPVVPLSVPTVFSEFRVNEPKLAACPKTGAATTNIRPASQPTLELNCIAVPTWAIHPEKYSRSFNVVSQNSILLGLQLS
jgi:hypothetical protein